MTTSAFPLRFPSLLILLGLCPIHAGTMGRCVAQENQQINQAIDAIRGAGKIGAGFDQAMIASQQLRAIPIDQLTLLLDGMADSNPIAENWFRGIVFGVARRANALPIETLSEYSLDRSNNPIGRGLAMELIRKDSPAVAEELIANCLDDVSLPLREMAVDQKIKAAQTLAKEQPDAAMTVYRQTLTAARHPQQLETIVEALRDLGDEEVNITSAFAMIENWHGVAPWTNVDDVGYDTAYPPEQAFTKSRDVDLTADYEGKHGTIQWQPLSASGDKGEVNLAKAFDKEKGAVSYLYTTFDSSVARPIQVRLGSKNANKVWVNGELLMTNHVYHSGSAIDQYIADGQLQQGENRILMKICQNEQTESWAQDWSFQFRITDSSGKPLRSGD